MVEINPRLEWRSFGRRFGAAEVRLAALTPGSIQESDQTYLLRTTSPRRSGPSRGCSADWMAWCSPPARSRP